MGNMSVINKRTFGSGFNKLVRLGVIGLGIYFLGPKVMHYVDHTRIKHKIESAIEERDFESATRLLNMHRRDGYLDREDISDIELDISRAREIKLFEDTVKSGNFN